MEIKQFYDKGLAHASYAIWSHGEMALIDPARDPEPYYALAKVQNAQIVAVIETHPHADFVSSHLEISKNTGAKIYISKLTEASFEHKAFDEGDMLRIGDVTLKALHTPGHSPDSICVLLYDKFGTEVAVFTGDTLFVGDVGRPDLRETVGAIVADRVQLASQMYTSIRDVLMKLKEEVLVYPAHGPGSLCGKNMSPDLYSTIGREIRQNYALQPMTRESFIDTLLADQPFMPKYFGYDVNMNKEGAEELAVSLNGVPRLTSLNDIHAGSVIVDVRSAAEFRRNHVKGAMNILDGLKFETWLGSIVGPEEKFYLLAGDSDSLESVIKKAAKIGYELNIAGALVYHQAGEDSLPDFDLDSFMHDREQYHIVDVRNKAEVKHRVIFNGSQHIPLPELRERISEINTEKPILIHCAGGYRSAIAVSIVAGSFGNGSRVFDLGEAINQFN